MSSREQRQFPHGLTHHSERGRRGFDRFDFFGCILQQVRKTPSLRPHPVPYRPLKIRYYPRTPSFPFQKMPPFVYLLRLHTSFHICCPAVRR